MQLHILSGLVLLFAGVASTVIFLRDVGNFDTLRAKVSGGIAFIGIFWAIALYASNPKYEEFCHALNGSWHLIVPAAVLATCTAFAMIMHAMLGPAEQK